MMNDAPVRPIRVGRRDRLNRQVSINQVDRTLPPIDARHYERMVKLLAENGLTEEDIVRAVNDE